MTRLQSWNRATTALMQYPRYHNNSYADAWIYISDHTTDTTSRANEVVESKLKFDSLSIVWLAEKSALYAKLVFLVGLRTFKFALDRSIVFGNLQLPDNARSTTEVWVRRFSGPRLVYF